MNRIFKVAIIGGGASGLLCATELLLGRNALNGSEVAILERNDRVGKKLVATGNGQGNISNVSVSSKNYSGDPAFISFFIEQFKDINPVRYLERLGIFTEADEVGRIYPVSRQANSVLDIIREYLVSKNCTVFTGFKATEVKENGGIFTVKAENGDIICAKSVVFAFGGKAAKQFGTDGSSYSLATAFNHKLTPLYPSLVQLKTDKTLIKGLKGIKENATISLYDGNKFIKRAEGDFMFTDYGVSGNAVFKVSDKVAGLTEPILKVDFLPRFTLKTIIDLLETRLKQGFIPKSDLLNGLVHKKLGEMIVKDAKQDIVHIAETVKAFTLKVVGTLGFDYAQTTKGGIKTQDVDPETYESKLKNGLYMIGEMLDVDGECGGYNLTFAFTSGITAARAVKKNYNN